MLQYDLEMVGILGEPDGYCFGFAKNSSEVGISQDAMKQRSKVMVYLMVIIPIHENLEIAHASLFPAILTIFTFIYIGTRMTFFALSPNLKIIYPRWHIIHIHSLFG